MVKEKVQKNKQRSTKHTCKTKDRVKVLGQGSHFNETEQKDLVGVSFLI
jgi:hypothetical protein